MLKDHVMCGSTKNFGMSQRMQEILCMLGQRVVFEEGSEVWQELLGLDISAKQIQRVSEYYGGKFADLIEGNIEAIIPQLESSREVILGISGTTALAKIGGSGVMIFQIVGH